MDDGWSGDILARPSLDRLRTDAKKKLWDGVLAYDPDRLARRGSYQALVMDELEELGMEILFVTTPAPKNIEDRMLYGMKGLFAGSMSGRRSRKEHGWGSSEKRGRAT